MVLVLLLPVTFVLVLGYAVECVRASDLAPANGPPGWGALGRIARSGAWMSIAVGVLTLPFAFGALLLTSALHVPALWGSSGTLLDVESFTAAALITALPWGLLLLVLMPHATARYAGTERASDLFDFAASIRSVRREFGAWNLAIATIVTAWAIGLACSALVCIGLVPGVFYAILVSAHATATLHPEGADSSTR